LEDVGLPPLDVYRRIQLGCYIIDEGISDYEEFVFETNSGRIVDYGVSKARLEEIIDSGMPFMTRGCAGEDGRVACNRPFANSPPGPELRNYPFTPTADDIKIIRGQFCTTEGIRV
jgi:biotin synthase